MVFGNIRNMVFWNMSSIKMLIRKGYLLAGVIMAANMYIVNEMRATENAKEQKDALYATISSEDQKDSNKIVNFASFSNCVLLHYENYINLIGGAVSSWANNYFQWWNYNPGIYGKLGCFGWRSGKFLKDIFQFDINLNIGRGVLWLIATFIGSYEYLKKGDPRGLTATAAVIINSYMNIKKRIIHYFVKDWILFFFLSSVQGFISVPLAIHISNFSIAISLDSILLASVGKFLSLVDGTEKEENKNEREFYINLSDCNEYYY